MKKDQSFVGKQEQGLVPLEKPTVHAGPRMEVYPVTLKRGAPNDP
jgi:hypothetical protein